MKATALTAATVNKSLAHLERLGVVSELTNRQRGCVFSYRRYVDEHELRLVAPAQDGRADRSGMRSLDNARRTGDYVEAVAVVQALQRKLDAARKRKPATGRRAFASA